MTGDLEGIRGDGRWQHVRVAALAYVRRVRAVARGRAYPHGGWRDPCGTPRSHCCCDTDIEPNGPKGVGQRWPP